MSPLEAGTDHKETPFHSVFRLSMPGIFLTHRESRAEVKCDLASKWEEKDQQHRLRVPANQPCTHGKSLSFAAFSSSVKMRVERASVSCVNKISVGFFFSASLPFCLSHWFLPRPVQRWETSSLLFLNPNYIAWYPVGAQAIVNAQMFPWKVSVNGYCFLWRLSGVKRQRSVVA